MSYTVFWKRHAEDQLAEIWSAANDRSAITKAADEIDDLLRHRPSAEGQSRPDGRRIMFSFPLGVLYRVIEDRQQGRGPRHLACRSSAADFPCRQRTRDLIWGHGFSLPVE